MEDVSEEFKLNETELQRLRELADLSNGSYRFQVAFSGEPYVATVTFVPDGFSVHLLSRISRDFSQVSFICSENGELHGSAGDQISWIKAFLNGYQVAA